MHVNVTVVLQHTNVAAHQQTSTHNNKLHTHNTNTQGCEHAPNVLKQDLLLGCVKHTVQRRYKRRHVFLLHEIAERLFHHARTLSQDKCAWEDKNTDTDGDTHMSVGVSERVIHVDKIIFKWQYVSYAAKA